MRRDSLPYSTVLFFNAMFGGITAVGLPLALNVQGLSKASIAMFFVVNAFIAIAYNTLAVPRVRKAGYPRFLLICTLTGVPVGTLIISSADGNLFRLYLGGALMLCVSAVVPQVFGRAGDTSGSESNGAMIISFRRVLIAGYIVGLLVYSACAELGLAPLPTAAAVSSFCLLGACSRVFSGIVFPRQPTLSSAAPRSRNHRATVALVGALCIVALLKSVDTLRGLYLPLVGVSRNIDPSILSLSFMLAALLEFAMLPLLGRLTRRHGAPLTIVAVSLTSTIVFTTLALSTGLWELALAQALYSFVGAGFQSVGLLLLAEVRGSDAGAGASAYMAVTQVGTVIGALLPLLVPGYSSAIFWVAALLSVTAAALGWAVARLTPGAGSVTEGTSPHDGRGGGQ